MIVNLITNQITITDPPTDMISTPTFFRPLLSAVVLLLIDLPIFAQKSFILSHVDRRGYLNVSVGSNVPMNDFLSKNNEDVMPRETMVRGQAFQVQAGYRLTRHWGVVGSLTHCINQTNTNLILRQAETAGYGSNWQTNAKLWNCTSVMAGPYVTFSPGRWMLDVRIQGGYALVLKPETIMNGNILSLPMEIKSTSEKRGGLSAGIGTSVRYKVGRNIALGLHADYVVTKATFENLQKVVTLTDVMISEQIQRQSFGGSLNVGAGVCFLF